MALVVLVIAINQFVHAVLLMNFRFDTLKSLLAFLEQGREKLGERDYKQLVNRYTGITRLFEPLPDEESYPSLYLDEHFASFIVKAKKRLKYYLLMTIGCFIALAVFASWLESNPQ